MNVHSSLFSPVHAFQNPRKEIVTENIDINNTDNYSITKHPQSEKYYSFVKIKHRTKTFFLTVR